MMGMKEKIISPVWEKKLQRGEQIMFKKNIWIVGLLTALAIMFVGCVDPALEDNSGVETVVFDLQEVIDGLPAGIIATDDDWSAIFKDTPFMMCGGPANGEYSIIKEKGVTKIKVDKMLQSWGVGFDLYQDAKPDACIGAKFRAGDTLYIKGTSVKGLICNANTSGEKRLGDIDLDGAFEETFTLTADQVSAIKGGNPKSLRIHYKSGVDRQQPIIIEQIVLTGKRGGNESESQYVIPGNGSYKVPTGTLPREEFYVDLNGATQAAMNASVELDAKLEANKLSFTLAGTNDRAGIYIPFSADVAKAFQGAADAGYSIAVTFDGTVATPTGKDPANFRWFITNGSGGDYATTNLVTATGPTAGTSTALAGGTLTFFNQNKAVKGFLIQTTSKYTPATTNEDGTPKDAEKDPQAKIEITSIKFKFNANADTIGAITTAQGTITINFPEPGWAPSSAIDSTGVTGSVKFLPNPAFGKFEKNTVYRAEITVTPKAGIYIPLAGTNLSVKNALYGIPTIAEQETVAVTVYDPIAGIIYTAPFTVTGSTDSTSPAEGLFDAAHGTFTQETGSTIKFNLNGADTATGMLNYIKTNYADAVTGTVTVKAGEFKEPLVDSGADSYQFVKNGLNISGRKGDAYRAIDINLTGDKSLGLNFAETGGKSYKITVWGNLLGTPASATRAVFHVPYSGSPWQSADIGNQASIGAYGKFEITGTITPTDWAGWAAEDPSGSINRIRVRIEDGNVAFRICRITVEELP